MKYEILYKSKHKILSSARLYQKHQEKEAIEHAREKRGKVRDRETGEIVHDFCVQEKEMKKSYIRIRKNNPQYLGFCDREPIKNPDYKSDEFKIIPEDDMGLDICNNIYGNTYLQPKKIAKLIAAAPEMLEALIDIYKEFKENKSNKKFTCQCLENLIEKATGLPIEKVLKDA